MVRMSAAIPLFDRRNQLVPPWPLRIRARLAAGADGPFADHCESLARALGAPCDPLALWALLMWNAPVTPELAVRLQAWVQRGMPLPPAATPGPVPIPAPRRRSRRGVPAG